MSRILSKIGKKKLLERNIGGKKSKIGSGLALGLNCRAPMLTFQTNGTDCGA